ncbi:hypothetical protein [Cupriavidus sp. IK-TO18]|uniref:hypothetical protein n=1 Tax=Cupriavidus sp. IK-TO18 TaxID=2782182 RepID=UPI00189980BF|nr:hypothetical protein [Cupriavidus sp. IK-TO18]MBF6986755.1 hypothetical protein [Cupriavidus sp. IK-TO18]
MNSTCSNPAESEASGHTISNASDAFTPHLSVVYSAPEGCAQTSKPGPASGSSHALNAGFTPAIQKSKFAKARLSNPEYAARYQTCWQDAHALSKTQLQARYPHEYNSLRGCRERAKRTHIKFDPKLKDIRDWLIHLGPRPAAGWTVDRISPSKGYECNNVRWATKIQQTQNRKVTKWHMVEGKRMTTKEMARHLGIRYDTLYKRLKRGWTVDRLLEHERKATGLSGWKFPIELADLLEPMYQRRTAYAQPRLRWFIAYLEKKMTEFPFQEDKIDFIFNLLEQAQQDLDKILTDEYSQSNAEIEQIIARMTPPKIIDGSQSPDSPDK